MKFSSILSRVLFFLSFNMLFTSCSSSYRTKQHMSDNTNESIPKGGRQNSGIGYVLGFFINDKIYLGNDFVEKRIPVSGIKEVNFIIDSSTIHMRSCLEKGDEILIKYKKVGGNGQVDFSETHGNLIVTSKDPSNPSSSYGFSVDYEVYAPIGTNVKINAKSVNTNIEDMNVEEINTGLASLIIKNNMAKKVDIKYGSGNSHFMYNKLPVENQDIKVHSGTGDVSFTLPSSSQINWYCHSTFGRISSDFDKTRTNTQNFNIHFHSGCGSMYINKNDEKK